MMIEAISGPTVRDPNTNKKPDLPPGQDKKNPKTDSTPTIKPAVIMTYSVPMPMLEVTPKSISPFDRPIAAGVFDRPTLGSVFNLKA